MPFSANIIL